MFKKSYNLYIVTTSLFVLAVIAYLVDKNYSQGIIYLVLAIINLILFIVIKRRDSSKESYNLDLLIEDQDFKLLVSNGSKIKAIKRCREISGCGLKEAKDYVDKIM